MTERLSAWVGRAAEVLVDQRNQADQRCYAGRISQNFTVNFREPDEALELGALVEARIIGRNRFTLIAELASA